MKSNDSRMTFDALLTHVVIMELQPIHSVKHNTANH